MGWDAHSSAEYEGNKKRLAKVAHRKAFLLAFDEVKTLAGSVDALLIVGSLDCSDCRRMLEEATGESCYSEDGWSAEKVKELNEKADWRLFFGKDDAWAYWSARKFLETCAELNLSISFSW